MSREATQPGGVGLLESILGLLKSLKTRALAGRYDNPIPTQFKDCLKSPELEFLKSLWGLGTEEE